MFGITRKRGREAPQDERAGATKQNPASPGETSAKPISPGDAEPRDPPRSVPPTVGSLRWNGDDPDDSDRDFLAALRDPHTL